MYRHKKIKELRGAISMEGQKPSNIKKNIESPKSSGLFIAAWFSVVGILLFYTPIYIGINGWGEKIINAFGWIAIIISIIGSINELSVIFKDEFSTMFKNDGFSYLGASLVFFVPAIILQIVQRKYLVNQTGIIFIKSLVILFIIIGFGVLLYGISFFFRKKS